MSKREPKDLPREGQACDRPGRLGNSDCGTRRGCGMGCSQAADDEPPVE